MMTMLLAGKKMADLPPAQEIQEAHEVVLREDLSAVGKLRKLFELYVRVPNGGRPGYQKLPAAKNKAAQTQTALMLILDVKTRWSSTHQMLRRALDSKSHIDDFVAKNRDFANLRCTLGTGTLLLY